MSDFKYSYGPEFFHTNKLGSEENCRRYPIEMCCETSGIEISFCFCYGSPEATIEKLLMQKFVAHENEIVNSAMAITEAEASFNLYKMFMYQALFFRDKTHSFM